jgi:hypothetical protein
MTMKLYSVCLRLSTGPRVFKGMASGVGEAMKRAIDKSRELKLDVVGLLWVRSVNEQGKEATMW